MSLAILFHFLCAQHVSDINISIIRSLRLFCWITTLVVLSQASSLRHGYHSPTQPHRNSNIHRTKNNTTNVVIQQNNRKLLMMDILMSETCWAHKKWNKMASDIKLVFYSSTITTMHGPINISSITLFTRGRHFYLFRASWIPSAPVILLILHFSSFPPRLTPASLPVIMSIKAQIRSIRITPAPN